MKHSRHAALHFNILLYYMLDERGTNAMRRWNKIMQVAFTYMGTIVGAGFATGQEIVQFFTRYGWMATLTIAASSALFIWLGAKLMLLSNEVGASSYEDLNKVLFGDKIGQWISLFTLVILFGITTVMLAGAGSLFQEQLDLPFQGGLLLTLILTYVMLLKGMDAILAVNSIVVPIMLAFMAVIVWFSIQLPSADNWLYLTSEYPLHRIWFSPLLYAAYNLAIAQAVLVPLGKEIRDRRILFWGGLLGGIGIGMMLLCTHFALSAQMPDIAKFEIPMGHLIRRLGKTIQLMYIIVIFAEIFTTFMSNVYGLCLQLQHRSRLPRRLLILIILFSCYIVSQIGFSTLLSVLYPLFGLVSLIWFVLIMWQRKAWRSHNT